MLAAASPGPDAFAPSERDRVLEAMARLCGRQGFEATTLAEAAREAGVPVATAEALFGDREECLLAAIHLVLGQTVAAMSSAYSEDLSEADSILAGAKAILELMAAQASYAKLAYIVSRHMAPTRVREAHEAATQALLVMMERLREYSTGDAPISATRAALGSAETVVRVEIAHGKVEELPRLLPPLTYGAMVPFLGQADALRLSRQAKGLSEGKEWGTESEPESRRSGTVATVKGGAPTHSAGDRKGRQGGLMERTRRKALLMAMLFELGERGYGDASVQRACEVAGVSSAEFEAEFGDLDTCLFAAYDDLSDQVVSETAAGCEASDPWPERIRDGLSALLALIASDPEMARVLTRSFPGIRPATYERYVVLLERFLPFMREGREYAEVDEELPVEVEMLAIGAAEAIIFSEVDAGRSAGLPRLGPEILFSVLVPFMGPERAADEMRAASGAI